jgi:hypothetical protein
MLRGQSALRQDSADLTDPESEQRGPFGDVSLIGLARGRGAEEDAGGQAAHQGIDSDDGDVLRFSIIEPRRPTLHPVGEFGVEPPSTSAA